MPKSTVAISFSIPTELVALVDAERERVNKSRSQFIVDALDAALGGKRWMATIDGKTPMRMREGSRETNALFRSRESAERWGAASGALVVDVTQEF